jgi:uncharacterized protein with PIN domain
MPKLVVCPKCGGKHVKLRKTWKLIGKIPNSQFTIELYDCLDCEKTFRKAVPLKGE